MDNKVFMMYANCIPVSGYNRSAIYDLTACNFDLVPSDMPDIISSVVGKTFIEINEVSLEKYEKVKSYIEYLTAKNYATWIDKKLYACFADLNLAWETPNIISNVIIENNINSLVDSDLFSVLTSYGCKNMQFRFTQQVSLHDFAFLIAALIEFPFNGISFYFFQSMEYSIDAIIDICNSYLPIRSINVFNSQFNDEVYTASNCKISFNTREVNKKIANNSLSVNMELFLESQKHNTYFNKKIYITESLELVELSNPMFLNYNGSDSISQKVNSDTYKCISNLSKNDILVCKQCEYRYMCVDERLPMKINQKDWYFDKECVYNPYICKWEHEIGFQTLEECGVIIDSNGIAINDILVKEIFSANWG